MATGIPRSRDSELGNAARLPALVYAGKAPVDEVLSHPPAALRWIWTPGSHGGPTASGSRLYLGDNLDVLAALASEAAVCGKVQAIYIDPPFATRADYHSRGMCFAYEDTLTGAAYLEFLRRRLILLREILAEDGSIYVHLDDKMVFHVKLIMDELFGSQHYQNLIVRRKCNPKNFTRKRFGNVADFILFYSKSDSFVWNQQFDQWTEARAKEYRYTDESGRRYMLVPVHAPGSRNGETGLSWRGIAPPPGKHWQFPPRVLDEMDARGDIHWSVRGNPRRKVYLDESRGVAVQDVWWDFPDPRNQNTRISGYPTEKNPGLLRRIVDASSRPGDLVLDCFCGSGTTLEAASSLGRKWIGIDSSPEAIKATVRRLIAGTEKMGDFVSLRPVTADAIPGQWPPVDGDPARTPARDFDVFAADGYESCLAGLGEEPAQQRASTSSAAGG